MSIINVTNCRKLAIIVIVAPLLLGCAGARVPYFMAEVPDDLRSDSTEAYPNINLAPDRPGRTRPQSEVQSLERELERERERHVSDAERSIESGRRQGE